MSRPEVTGKRVPWKAPDVPDEFSEERILDLPTCAAIAGIAPHTLRQWAHNGKGPPLLKLGQRRYGVIWREFKKWRDERVFSREASA